VVDQAASNQGRNVLVLNYTMACPLQCDFCCYGCGPRRHRETMSLLLAHRLINEAADMGNFSSVAFTGGEPLLFPEQILKLADTLKARGLPFSVATAAHWATEESTVQLVSALAERGLEKVGISCDPAHEKFVPKANVLRAATAFVKAGVRTFVVGSFLDSWTTMESYFPELADVKGVSTRTHSVCAVGRARKTANGSSSSPSKACDDSLQCYRTTYHDIVVFHDGQTYPCCSVFNRAAHHLCVGNATALS
jgi:Radical SAM superfamily